MSESTDTSDSLLREDLDYNEDLHVVIEALHRNMKSVLPPKLYALYSSVHRPMEIPQPRYGAAERGKDAFMATTSSYALKRFTFESPLRARQTKRLEGTEKFLAPTQCIASKFQGSVPQDKEREPVLPPPKPRNWMQDLANVQLPPLPPKTSPMHMKFFIQQLTAYADYLAAEIAKFPSPD